MSTKRALIVDDSRSARAFLTRILERYDLQVDSVESAEEAIEYLNRSRPDVIFLDHLMPGMDGFQALSLIKNDPRTATIPVMMYTSQEGELYLSQARALGAVGVLPKQIKPVDVSRTLEQLRLLGDRPPESDTVTVRVPVRRDQEETVNVSALPAAGLTPELRAQLDTMLRDHGIELRRFVTHSLQLHGERMVSEVRALMDEAIGQGSASAVSPVLPSSATVVTDAAPVRTSRAVLWLSAAAAAIAVFAGVLWIRSVSDDKGLSARLDPTIDSTGVVTPVPVSSAVKLMPEIAPRASTPRNAALLVETVPFGEAPLAGGRIEPIQKLLERLSASGFRGTVEIRSFAGRFCTQGAGDAAALPAADIGYAKCDQVGSVSETVDPAAHESVSFANMLSAQRSHSGGAFEVHLVAGPAEEWVAPYPTISEGLTAGEWNRAAAANNRVEVRTAALP